MTFQHYSASGPGMGGGGRFAPKYLVGNTAAPYNDDGSAYAEDGFFYFPDPGDCSGIRAALAAAAVTPGDVWIRPGRYLLDADEPVLAIPSGVRVQGAGDSTLVERARALSSIAVFSLSGASDLRDMKISVFNESVTASGLDAGVVIVDIQVYDDRPKDAYLERVHILLSNNTVQDRALSGVLLTGGKLTMDRCSISLDGFSCGDPRVSPYGLVGVRVQGRPYLSRATIDACRIVANPVFGEGSPAAAVVGGAPSFGEDAAVDGGKINIEESDFSSYAGAGVAAFGTDLSIVGSTISVYKDLYGTISTAIYIRDNVGQASRLCVGHSTIEASLNLSGDFGIDADVSGGQITGNTISGKTGILSANAAGNGLAIGFNTVTALPAQQILAQPVDEVAHNILLT